MDAGNHALVRHWSDRAGSELLDKVVAVKEVVVARSDGRVERLLPLSYPVEAW